MVAIAEVAADWALGAGALGSALVLLSLGVGWAAREGVAARLGWNPGAVNTRSFVWGVVGILALSHGVEAWLRTLGLGPSPVAVQLSLSLRDLPVGKVVLVGIALAGIAPLGEELFFRGVLQRGLRRTLGRGGAWVAASALFGLAHGELALGLGAFALGLALGWIFDRAGSLWLPLGAHAVNNTVAVAEAWLAPPGGSEDAWVAAGLATAGGLWALARMARALGHPCAAS